MQGVAKTKLTPDMLSIAGLTLCIAGAVLVGFEERNEYLFFWLGGALFVAGSVADILDGALARAASKGTVFGAFLDSTFDRLGEAAMLTAIGLVFMREGNEVALVAAFAAVIGSFLVSYTRAKAEALGLRGDVGFGSRLERVVIVSVGARGGALGLARMAHLPARGDGLDHRRATDALRAQAAARPGSLVGARPASSGSMGTSIEIVGRDAELATIDRVTSAGADRAPVGTGARRRARHREDDTVANRGRALPRPQGIACSPARLPRVSHGSHSPGSPTWRPARWRNLRKGWRSRSAPRSRRLCSCEREHTGRRTSARWHSGSSDCFAR